MSDVSQQPSSACIIGLGSRGLGILERIITLTSQRAWAGRAFTLDIVDPACDGRGIHLTTQPDYLLLNTICCQVSPFPEEASVGATAAGQGPTLHEWVRERGLRIAADGYTLGSDGREIRPDDYLPRRILGDYLNWYLQHILDRAPEHLAIRFHRAEAIELAAAGDGARSLTLTGGAVLTTRHVFLTTGHTPSPAGDARRPGEYRRVRHVYPPQERFAPIAAGQSVALAGTGLSCMDALAALTLGRGGSYTVAADGSRVYRPSGREPRIVLFSRSGLPFRARPGACHEAPAYQSLVLTPAGIDQARSAAQGGALDLHADLLPLVCTEMRIAFHRRAAGLLGGHEAEQTVIKVLGEAHSTGTIETELARLDSEHAPQYGEFDPRQILFPEPGGLQDRHSYQDWYANQLASDLREAARGLAGSPLKAALEVLRSQRDALRHAVDFHGLEESSHQEFYESFNGVLNRSVTGPQLERHQELLALLRAGIVSVPLGPQPTLEWNQEAEMWELSSTQLGRPHTDAADWLVHASSPQPDIQDTTSDLLLDLAGTGRIRRHRTAGSGRGVDITPEQHPIGTDGAVDEQVWILGSLTEGATFYNHYVPSPGGSSRALVDAHRCVAAMLEAAAAAGVGR
ncbi:FAD/NAD(P)-binding protein [Streptomyces sp. NPDC050636]|uniref:FAD/NAD(P)-binding protein n=1 Tax=Streptomyces sp. NPDC050636 TaxID=3154510 RepID=UPI003431972C